VAFFAMKRFSHISPVSACLCRAATNPSLHYCNHVRADAVWATAAFGCACAALFSCIFFSTFETTFYGILKTLCRESFRRCADIFPKNPTTFCGTPSYGPISVVGFGYFNHRPPLGSCPNGGGVRVCVRRKPPLGSCVCAYNKSIIIIMHAAAAGAHTAAAAASPLIYMSDKNKKCVRTYVRVCARALVRACARARVRSNQILFF
jgi:hypothetical protein